MAFRHPPTHHRRREKITRGRKYPRRLEGKNIRTTIGSQFHSYHRVKALRDAVMILRTTMGFDRVLRPRLGSLLPYHQCGPPGSVSRQLDGNRIPNRVALCPMNGGSPKRIRKVR